MNYFVKRSKSESEVDLIWYDGFFNFEKYFRINPSKYITKIPGMYEVCKRLNFIKTVKQIKNSDLIFPQTFIIPDENEKILTKFQNGKFAWIYKPIFGFNSEKIELLQQLEQIEYYLSHKGIIQQYITPKTLNGFKFDFRIYLMITDLNPVSLYIYREGIARFCSEKYDPSNIFNPNNRFIEYS